MRFIIILVLALVSEWKIGSSKRIHFRTRMVDLTHTFYKDMPEWPTLPAFAMNESIMDLPDSDIKIKLEDYSSPTHAGTHMDAPCHVVGNNQSIADIPLERLVAPAVVVDIRDKVALDADYELQIEDILQLEEKTYRCLNKIILLVLTGYSKNWSNRTAYIGNPDNDVNNMHFPGISANTSRWLVDNRNLVGVGLDTFSADYGPSKDFPTHQIFLGKNIYILENLNNLEELPVRGATLYVMPMKIGGACGAPCRVVARFLYFKRHGRN